MADYPARLTTESSKAYAAFTTYCAFGAGRSCEQVAAKYQKSVSLIYRWCRVHSWIDRVEIYDAQLAKEAAAATTAQYLADLEAFRLRTQRIGQALYVVAGKLLERMNAELDTVEIKANTLLICARAIVMALDLEAYALQVDKLLSQLDWDE
jgi:hypothetical protein